MPGLKQYESPQRTQGQVGNMATPALGEASKTLDSLSNRLQNFSSNVFKLAGENAKVEAGNKAVRDMSKYKSDIDYINKKYSDKNNKEQGVNAAANNTERLKELDTLKDSHEYDGWGRIYKNSYKNSFDAAYTNTVTADTIVNINTAIIESKGSSEKFKNMFNSFQDSVIRTAPNEEVAASSKLTMATKGSAAYKALALAENRSGNTERKKSSQEVLDYLKDEYITAQANGMTGIMEVNLSNYKAALVSAVNEGFLTREAAEVRLNVAAQDATVASIHTRFTGTLQQAAVGDTYGQEVETTEEVLESIVTSKEFMLLPQKKKDELRNTLFGELNAHDSEKRQEQADLDKIEDEDQEAQYRETLSEIFLGTVKLQDINDMEASNELTQSDAASLRITLSQGSRGRSDEKAKASYSRDDKLINSDDDQIWQDTRLSWPDKTSLITKRRELLTSKEYKWTTTQNGKEARSRIKNHFGFREGALIVNIDNATEKAYNDIMIQLFDEISGLDEAEQSKAAIPLANKLIAGYEQGLKDIETQAEEAREAKRQKKADEAWNEYDTGWTSMFNSLTEKPFKQGFYKQKGYGEYKGNQ